MPIEITPHIAISDEELEWKYIRASGPGGQNVNKVSSAVQLRFLLSLNTSLPVSARNRLRALAGQKMVDDGSILFTARTERSQEQNRRAAAGRLTALIRSALIEPKIRKKTRPTKGSQERRIETKKRRGATKSQRGRQAWD
ncbi:MAG TPA: alternative ribosome rescue aminoacyl-tRNA hydrolase ArfB [Steroidobacteraceae bacterium]|jgi:ribosome-associated protein|nr:alternative ribosome rescue aminoacyl-tRNA hydrolase ArfB [Steroidobacteraceae bacterium]